MVLWWWKHVFNIKYNYPEFCWRKLTMFQEIFIHFPAQFSFQERTAASKETGDGEVYGRPLGPSFKKNEVFFPGGKAWENVGTIWRKTLEMEGFPMENHWTRWFWWFSIFDCQIQRARGWSRAVFESSQLWKFQGQGSKTGHQRSGILVFSRSSAGFIWHGGLWWWKSGLFGCFEIFELNHS